MQRATQYISNLTPLRGIAAIMIVVFHFEEILARFVKPENSMLIRKCYLMVDLFFIMSGFVMLHVYGKSFSWTLKSIDFFKFIRARFARLYPLHLFTLLLAIALFYGSHGPANPINNPAAIPTHLLLLQSFGIHSIFTWNVPSWSISAEWWCYMLFPILVMMLSKNSKSIYLLILLSATIYFSILYLLPRVNPFMPAVAVPHNLDVTYDYGFLRGLAGFIAGMITYTLYQQQKIIQIFSKDAVGFICIGLTLIALHFGVNDIIYIPLFMLLVLGIAANSGIIHKIFLIRPLQYVGDISYSIYLMHGLLIFIIAAPLLQNMGYVYKGPGSLSLPFWTGLGICSLFLLVVIGVSSITYFLIEKPCRSWINGKNKKKAAEFNTIDTSNYVSNFK